MRSLIVGVLLVVVIIVVILFLCLGSSSRGLLRLLLLLVRLLWLGVRLGQGKLQNLENLLICDLLVGFPLRNVWLRRRGQFLDAVLGNCCRRLAQTQMLRFLRETHTNSRKQAADWLAVCGANDLVLTDDTTTHTLNHTDLSGTLVIKLP